MDSNATLFNVAKDPSAPAPVYPPNFDYDQLRSIAYNFPPSFLDLKTIGTSLRFQVGEEAVANFRMIERYYDHENKLIRVYDFDFPFCMPSSTNEMEAVYSLPELTAEQKAGMISKSPGSCSDSFYFVGNTLVMHNKAFYTYQN